MYIYMYVYMYVRERERARARERERKYAPCVCVCVSKYQSIMLSQREASKQVNSSMAVTGTKEKSYHAVFEEEKQRKKIVLC
jgi:hypothetical protein